MDARRLVAVVALTVGVSLVGTTTISAAGASRPPAAKVTAGSAAAEAIDQLGSGLGSRWVFGGAGRARAQLDARQGSVIEASVQVAASLPLHSVAIEIQSTGPLAVPGGRSIRIAHLTAGSTLTVPVHVRVTAPGSGTIDARMIGYAGSVPVGSDAEIGYATGAGRVAFSLNGQLAAQVAALAFVRPRIGELRYESRLQALLGGGASWQITVGQRRPGAVPATTKVSGTISYTASNGSKHPARTIVVEVKDDTGGAGTVVTSTTTNASGQYSATVSTLRSDKKTPRKLFVEAEAESNGFAIDPVGSATVQHVDSGTQTAAGKPLMINMTANNVADNNTAFDVADALVTGVQYTKRINGGHIFGMVTASFPDPGGTNFSPGTGTARILHDDRFDWDVILHEYGHYVASKLGIDHSPGGPHSFTQNLGETLGKGPGILLAWSEGFATWFGITAEWVLGASGLHIPLVGDTYYDDTEDAHLHVDLATNTPYPSIGEDNELSVMRTLWHFFSDAAIKMSDLTIISTLKASAADTLSKAVTALLPAGHAAPFNSSSGSPAAVKHSNDFACVLTNQQVSPKVTAPKANTTIAAGSPQTYTWMPYGAGPSNRLDSFIVQFWSENWGKLLYASPKQAATTYTATAAVWQNLILNTKDETGNLPNKINVVIVGWGTHAPQTGPYDGCAITDPVARITAVGVVPANNDGKPVIASIPTSAACTETGEVPAQLNQFNLNGTNLPPNTAYTLTMHDPAGKFADQVLANTWTSNASGGFTAAVPAITVIPSLTTWQLIAKPASGTLTPMVVTPIGWTTCILWNPDASPMPIEWGGSGLGPNSSATETFSGTAEPAITADPTGLYDGNYEATCTTASPTISVAGTFLDGTPAAVTYEITNMCTPSGGTGTTGTGTTGAARRPHGAATTKHLFVVAAAQG